MRTAKHTVAVFGDSGSEIRIARHLVLPAGDG